MPTFKNIHHTRRDYEATNKVACVAEVAPDDNWIPCDVTELHDLDSLYTEISDGKAVRYYGYL